MAKGRGRGKGKGGSAFTHFIDDSFFAFWFRQWAAFFLIVGIILIIVGVVVGLQIPKNKENQFATDQAITGPDASNYGAWSAPAEKVSYYFSSLATTNPGPSQSIGCNMKGPFVFDVIPTKNSIVFSPDGMTVSYTVTSAKSFRPSDSAAIENVVTINPSYVQLVQNYSSEIGVMTKVYQTSTIPANLQSFYKTTVPTLIGARGIGQSFASSIQTHRETVIFPSFYSPASGLNKTVTDYSMKYLITKADNLACLYCNGGAAKGVSNNIRYAWINNPACRAPFSPDDTSLSQQLVAGFTGLTGTDTACINFLKGHAFNSAAWAAGDNTKALTILSTMTTGNLSLWYDPNDPTVNGYCATTSNRASAATLFSATVQQINDVCDRFLNLFFNDPHVLPSTIARKDIGSFAFCNGYINSTDPTFAISSIPSEVASVMPSLTLSNAAAADPSKCSIYLNALADVTNFIIPAFNNPNVRPTNYQGTITTDDYAILVNYINKFALTYKQLFTSYWRGPAGSYGCASCTLRPLAQFANNAVFNSNSQVMGLLFPETVPQSATDPRYYQYSLSHNNPTPILTIGQNMFSNITTGNGVLNYVYNLDSNVILGIWTWNDAQHAEINTYSSALVNNYLTSVVIPANGLSTIQDVGYLQFAQAKLACGNSTQTRCPVANTFFGLTLNYYHEVGIASYVPSTSSPQYYSSFTTADSALRDTLLASDAATLLTFIQNVPGDLTLTTTNHKYFFYLLSTFIKDSAFTSSSGLLASRSVVDWLNGVVDASVMAISPSISSPFGFEPEGATGHSFQIKTGHSPQLNQAYEFSQVDGAASVSLYPTPFTVDGLYNVDGFPPRVFASDGLTLNVLDPKLLRPLKYVFTNTKVTLENIPTQQGTVPSTEWNTNTAFGIATNNLMPQPGSHNLRYYSSCSDTVAATCSFGSNETLQNSLWVDPRTGLVARYDNCFVHSFSLPTTFPISLQNTASYPVGTIVSQVQRYSTRTLSPDVASAYVKQFSDVDRTASSVLIALVIVGGLFIALGVIWVVFYFVRRSRKLQTKSKMELVEDPFSEKDRSVGNLKY